MTNHTDNATKRTNCPVNRHCVYYVALFIQKNYWNLGASGLVFFTSVI